MNGQDFLHTADRYLIGTLFTKCVEVVQFSTVVFSVVIYIERFPVSSSVDSDYYYLIGWLCRSANEWYMRRYTAPTTHIIKGGHFSLWRDFFSWSSIDVHCKSPCLPSDILRLFTILGEPTLSLPIPEEGNIILSDDHHSADTVGCEEMLQLFRGRNLLSARLSVCLCLSLCLAVAVSASRVRRLEAIVNANKVASFFFSFFCSLFQEGVWVVLTALYHRRARMACGYIWHHEAGRNATSISARGV